MIALAKPHHFQELCAAGKCVHAVSERNPCRCPQCDPQTAEMVAGYRNEAALAVVNATSQMTPRFAERTFDKFEVTLENRHAYEAALAVAEDPARGVGFFGSMGVGKSHLAAAIVNASIRAGVAARFVSIDDLLAQLRQTYDPKSSGSEHAIIRAYAEIPVLVLDDLGKESLSDWTVRTLFSLVNRRYERNLPLIVTSNFSPLTLTTRQVAKDAEPVTYTTTIDRMREMVGQWLEIAGRSRR